MMFLNVFTRAIAGRRWIERSLAPCLIHAAKPQIFTIVRGAADPPSIPASIDLTLFDPRLQLRARPRRVHREKRSLCLYRQHLPQPDRGGAVSTLAREPQRY